MTTTSTRAPGGRIGAMRVPRRRPHRASARRLGLWRVIVWGLLVAMVLGWWAFLRPSSLGGPVTFITVTGVSMEPGMHTDDVAVMYKRNSYATGDVVAFRSTNPQTGVADGPFVIHRIKGGNGDTGFVMRGDNNDWDDPWTPTTDEVAGEMVFFVPNLGAAMRWISQPVNLAALLAAVMTMLVIGGGPSNDAKKRPDEASADESIVPAQRSGSQS